MKHLIYASAATRAFTDVDIAAIVDDARQANERAGVTGLLLFADGTFFQVLEGPDDEVDDVYARIAGDRRHTHTTVIVDERIAARSFAASPLAFAAMSARDMAVLVGARDFFGGRGSLHAIDAERARQVFQAFATGRWRHRLAGAPAVAA